MAKKFGIRNSTAEFLTFVAEGKGKAYKCYIKTKRYGLLKKQRQ